MDSTVLFIDIHISNNKIKEKVTLSVGLIEEPHLSISGLSGHLTYHKLDSIIAVSNGFEINYEIIHFKANFISNNKLVYFVEHNGNKFSDEDRIQYLNMKSGDIIELNEVLVVGNKKIFQKLDGAKFPIY